MKSVRNLFSGLMIAVICGQAWGAQEGKLAPRVRYAPVVYARSATVSSELCPRAERAPKVDGALDDAVWKNALVAREFFLLGNGRSTPSKTQTHVFFLWDDAYLYIGARCFDPKARELKAPARLDKPDGDIGWGDSLEFFLDTTGAGEEAYQIAVDLAGNVWDAHHKADDSIDQAWSSNAVAASGREDGAWTLEVALPLKSFGVKTLAGRTWGLNAGRNARVFPDESNTAWCGAYLAPKVFQRALFARPAAAAVTQISRGEGVVGANWVRGVVASLTDESREIEARCVLTLPGAQPRTESVRLNLPGRGKASFELPYEIPPAWMAKNPQGKGVTLAVTVADVKTKQTLWSSVAPMEPPAAVSLEMDRKVYGFDLLDGQAFLTVNVSPSLLSGAAVRLALTPDGAPRPVKGQLLACADRRATLGVDLAALTPGAYELSATLMAGGEALATAVAPFVKAEGQSREPARARVPLVVKPVAAGVKTWPVTTGVPFPPGALRSDANVRLLGPDGQEKPCQVRTTARWTPNGHVQWLLVDFSADVAADREVTYQLEYGTDVKRGAFASPLKVEDAKDAVTVVTGPLKFVTPKAKGQWLAGVWLDANGDGQFAESERAAGGGAAWLTQHTGTTFSSDAAAPLEVAVEESGPRRVVVKVAGWQQSAAGARSGQYVTRIMAYAGEPFVRIVDGSPHV
ncbi:MAG TPA: sugar-binding protein, partial [Candidatus Brocadiia bacterium]|nr:sugar-binding protein [Candidatus Brocadiia bacterium]